MKSYAVISDDQAYRYVLGRSWGDSRHAMTFVMLNPSTADAEVDDPTIRRCIGFAKREGCNRVRVINLFAWRATNPKDVPVRDCPLAVGPDNASHWNIALDACGGRLVVAAWGSGSGLAHQAAFNTQARKFRALCIERGVQLLCLGRTQGGQPRHPLYVKGDAPLIPYEIAR